mmetsp:Transcript_8006/g.12446  ORF Transcript_8006/g.12446 Transcript_8006/m.12446 type:complete len:323 (-) Transcript_8006:7642-8610(-)
MEAVGQCHNHSTTNIVARDRLNVEELVYTPLFFSNVSHILGKVLTKPAEHLHCTRHVTQRYNGSLAVVNFADKLLRGGDELGKDSYKLLEWIIFRILMLHLLHELLHLLRVEAWPTSLAPRTLGALLQIQDGDEIIRSLSPHTRVSSAVHCLRHESANTFHLLLLGIALCTGLADLCVGLLLLGLFFLLFCAQVDRELALENCRYVQGFSFSGESTKIEDVVNHRLGERMHAIDEVLERVADSGADILSASLKSIECQSCHGLLFKRLLGLQTVWVASSNNLHRRRQEASLHRSVADDLFEQTHAVARVDFVEEDYDALLLR